ncbi:PREDICTED: putative F-box protein At3g24700 [Camelina sativa]|uniref:F-box protein At3g24700 n=1 Tax=Camelina sativa TaxID=90675 RepID=A0ABM0WRC2_CAMSA|nr:PREDICTED: putative F-box protein At3g24700 [Camelina sativa]
MVTTDLPHDLETEILSRVPATCLQKLQTTCKRWYALFRDPRFAKKNFGKAAAQVILINDYRGYSATLMDTLIHRVNLHGIQNSFDPSFEVAVELNKLNDSEQFKLSSILTHCEGLLLCTTEDSKLVVWNPCTGQTRWIQSGDYWYSPPKFEIYEFNSEYSWRVLDDVSPKFFIHSNGVTLKGNAYWYASDKEDPLFVFILKFDFATERFGRMRLPLSFKRTSYVGVVLSVVREEKLALLQQHGVGIDSLKMDIWVTKTKMIDEAKDLSWSNFLVVDLGKVMLPGPDVMSHIISFLVDEKNKMVVCCDTELPSLTDPMRTMTKFYFAIEGIQVHNLIVQEPQGTAWPFLVSYVPSLVQIH